MANYLNLMTDVFLNSKIVIILTSTFAEFLYNCIDNDIRDINYFPFNSIIEINLGEGVRNLISDVTIYKFSFSKSLSEVAA